MGDGGRAGQIESQRRLADARSCSHHQHLSGLQAVDDGVEIGEPGRYTSAVAAAGDGLDLVQGARQQGRHRLVVGSAATVGDGHHLGLGPVDDGVDLTFAGRGPLRDPGRRVLQLPQDRLLADDVGVEAGVRGERDTRRSGHAGTARRRSSPADPRRPSSAATVTGSTGSPRPYRSTMRAEDLLVRRAVEVVRRSRLRRPPRPHRSTTAWRRAHTAPPSCRSGAPRQTCHRLRRPTWIRSSALRTGTALTDSPPVLSTPARTDGLLRRDTSGPAGTATPDRRPAPTPHGRTAATSAGRPRSSAGSSPPAAAPSPRSTAQWAGRPAPDDRTGTGPAAVRRGSAPSARSGSRLCGPAATNLSSSGPGFGVHPGRVAWYSHAPHESTRRRPQPISKPTTSRSRSSTTLKAGCPGHPQLPQVRDGVPLTEEGGGDQLAQHVGPAGFLGWQRQPWPRSPRTAHRRATSLNNGRSLAMTRTGPDVRPAPTPSPAGPGRQGCSVVHELLLLH